MTKKTKATGAIIRTVRRTIVCCFFVSAAALGLAAAKVSRPGPQDRITICHKPGTPAGHTLTLPPKAAAEHLLKHNDTFGVCPGQPVVIVTPREAIPISGPSFNTVAEASQYIAKQVSENDLGEVGLERNEVGDIVGVSGNTTSAVRDTIFVRDPEAGVQELDRFSTVLGGLGGFITVEGNRVCLRDEGCGVEPESVRAVQPPMILGAKVEVCDRRLVDNRGKPLFCTRNESFRVNLFFYKSIGSETSITRGGVELDTNSCLVNEFGGGGFGGGGTGGGTFVPGGTYCPDCALCPIKAGSHTALTLNQTYFGTFPPTFDNPTVVDTRFKTAIDTNFIKSKHWRFAVRITTECPFANKCQITGVCATHASSTEQDFGIGETRANTNKGDVGQGAPDCPASPPPIP